MESNFGLGLKKVFFSIHNFEFLGYNANSLWRGLTSSLSGMFCAALEQVISIFPRISNCNKMGVVYTSSSKLSFAHEGKIVEGKSSNYSENNMRYRFDFPHNFLKMNAVLFLENLFVLKI